MAKKIKTFLNPANDGLKYNEQFIGGVKNEQRSVEENKADGFYFEDCEMIDFIHPLGTVYVFNEYGYVANGYTWWRFKMTDLRVLSN